jgi:hypothetical protein
VRFHWQNLNEKPGGRTGTPLRHGRAWLAVGAGGLHWEWTTLRARCAIHLGLVKHEERGVVATLAIPLLFSVHVLVHGGPFARLAARLLPEWTWENGEDREVSLRVFDWAIWWEVWRDPMASWSRRVPRWRCGNFHPVDFLFGRTTTTERVLREEEVVVPLPERGYRGKVRLDEITWRRPRWPFAWRRVLSAHVDMAQGEQVPVPGKGESAHDCGEDATYSLSTTAATVEEAVAAMVESVLRTRRRHGGSVGWRPEA